MFPPTTPVTTTKCVLFPSCFDSLMLFERTAEKRERDRENKKERYIHISVKITCNNSNKEVPRPRNISSYVCTHSHSRTYAHVERTPNGDGRTQNSASRIVFLFFAYNRLNFISLVPSLEHDEKKYIYIYLSHLIMMMMRRKSLHIRVGADLTLDDVFYGSFFHVTKVTCVCICMYVYKYSQIWGLTAYVLR